VGCRKWQNEKCIGLDGIACFGLSPTRVIVFVMCGFSTRPYSLGKTDDCCNSPICCVPNCWRPNITPIDRWKILFSRAMHHRHGRLSLMALTFWKRLNMESMKWSKNQNLAWCVDSESLLVSASFREEEV
jgi:hypothetical protein